MGGGGGSEESTGPHTERGVERTLTEAWGLIEVSTFKVANVVPRAGDIIYLFTPHSITAARPQNWLRAAPLPRDRDSRRYLHANSFQTRFRTRKNPHRGESRPRARARASGYVRYSFWCPYSRASSGRLSPSTPPVSRRRPLRLVVSSFIAGDSAVFRRRNRAFLNY